MTTLVEAILDWIDLATASLVYLQELPQEYKIDLVAKLSTIRKEVTEWKKYNE